MTQTKNGIRGQIWIICGWLSLACLPLLAQEPGGRDPLMESLSPPDLVMSHQEAIGLNEVQMDFLQSEILKAQARFTELQRDIQATMETLVGLLQENSVDEQKTMAQLDKELGLEREIKRAQIALMVRIKNKLTPGQQAKLRRVWAASNPQPTPP